MHNFRELKIWKAAMQLAIDICKLTRTFPEDEKLGMCIQLKRCSVSVPSNIAEGSSRKSNKDFSRFLSISLGSLFEMETQVIISKELGYMEAQTVDTLVERIIELQKMIRGFDKTLI